VNFQKHQQIIMEKNALKWKKKNAGKKKIRTPSWITHNAIVAEMVAARRLGR